MKMPGYEPRAPHAMALGPGWAVDGGDRLPERLLAEPVRLACGREAGLTPERLRAMIDGDHAGRGLDGQRRPDEALLADLRLS